MPVVGYHELGIVRQSKDRGIFWAKAHKTRAVQFCVFCPSLRKRTIPGRADDVQTETPVAGEKTGSASQRRLKKGTGGYASGWAGAKGLSLRSSVLQIIEEMNMGIGR